MDEKKRQVWRFVIQTAISILTAMYFISSPLILDIGHGPRRDELYGSRLDTVGYSKSRQTERPLLSYQRQYDVILDSRRYPRLYDAIQDRVAFG